MLGISAWHLLRKTENRDFFQRSARIATVYGMIGIVLVILVGHTQAQHMVETQPMKMAAAEGLFESEDPASFSLITIGDLDQREEVFAIRIPKMLSLLAYNKLAGEVKGINDLQASIRSRVRRAVRLSPAHRRDLLELPRDGRRRVPDVGAGRRSGCTCR